MKLINIYDYNRAILLLEDAIRDCRGLKRTPEAYQRTADNLKQKAINIAVMLEREKEIVIDEQNEGKN